MSKILVIAAHPDDEVLGAGGTIARLVENGEEVGILILGEGVTSRAKSRKEADKAAVKALQETAERVAAHLGAKHIWFGGLPDNRFDSEDLLDVAKGIEAVIQEFQPDTVYTQSAGDLNIDHMITNRATLIATRPYGSPVEQVYEYEVGSSSEWFFDSEGFNPNVFMALGPQHVTKKFDAMRMYESEDRPYPHPRSMEALLAQVRMRGVQAGVEFAEAFRARRVVVK